VELRELRVVDRRAFRQELQGDRLIECEVLGPVHFAHAAAPEQRHEPVAARNDGTGRETAGRRHAAGRRAWGRRRERDVGVADASGHVGIGSRSPGSG